MPTLVDFFFFPLEIWTTNSTSRLSITTRDSAATIGNQEEHSTNKKQGKLLKKMMIGLRAKPLYIDI
jgi:hypothetical protein